MSDVKIPELPTGRLPTGEELLLADQDGQTRQFTGDEMRSANTATLHLYVHADDGADGNDGLTASTPVATLARVYQLVPRFLHEPVIIHMSSGTYVFADAPVVVPMSKTGRLWLVGDGAGDITDDPYQVVATATVDTIVDGGRGAIVDLDITTFDEFTGLQVVVTSGDLVGLESSVRRCLDASDTVEFAGDVDMAVGDTFDMRRSAINIEVPWTADTTRRELARGVGRSVGGSHEGGGVGFRNVSFISLKPGGSDVHQLLVTGANLFAVGTRFEGFKLQASFAALQGSASLDNMSPATWRNVVKGLDYATSVNFDEQQVWGSNGFLTEAMPAGIDFQSEMISLVNNAQVEGYVVMGSIFAAFGTRASPLGGRVAFCFISGGSVDMSSSDGFCVDGDSAFGSVYVQGSSAAFSMIFTFMEIQNRGGAPCVNAEGGNLVLGSIAGGTTGGPAVKVTHGGRCIFNAAPTLTGGTLNEDIEVEGEPVIANSAMTVGAGTQHTASGAVAYRQA